MSAGAKGRISAKLRTAGKTALQRTAFVNWFLKMERSAVNRPTVVPVSFPLQDPPPEHKTALSIKVGSRFEVTIQGDFHQPVLEKLIRTLEAMA